MFVSAWDQVFTPEKTRYGVELDPLGLLEVLRLDKDVHEWMNHKPEPEKPRRSSDSIGDAYETLESNLSTYSTLGCLICFNHSCEHGFFTDDNKKERFSLDTGWLSRRLAERHKHTLPAEKSAVTPCTRNCYKSVSRSEGGGAPWSNDDRKTLHSIFMAFSFGRLRTDPACHVAFLLNRECCDVQSEYKNMRLTMYRPTAREIEKADHEIQNLSWYNRFEKKLSKRHSQSKYHTPNWDHLNRDIDDVCALRGCDHDGPCERDNPDCPCAQKGQFCEKFCGCSVESCAYRFTGCACHVSRGKCCFDDQKGEPCICIQLNRECDADLCGTCGAAERADPVNARDDKLHGSGCQNCALQRGVGKSLVLGRSQLHGYGVYAAEDIRKDEFIAEYAGEIVSGAEGDRRYIRRQNLFDGTKPLSFNFTLLKECDVWVDGARFGNLSRYVNHVKEGNLQCNVTPIIMLVNGGFRIKFKAKRKIKAWEELFFDYGDDFDLEPEKDKGKKKNRASDSARKNAYRAADDDSSTYSADDHEFSTASQKHDHLRGRRKRKRDTPESLEEDYQPTSSSASTPAPSKDDAKDDAERTPVANNQGTAKRRTRRSASAQDQSTSRSPRRPLKRRRLSSKPNAKAPAKMTKAGQAINRPRNVPGSTAASAMEISDSEASNEESEDSEGSEDDEGSCDSESDERPGVDQRSDGKRGDRDDIDDESDGSEGSESQSSVSDDEGVDYDSTPTKAERPTRMRKQPARYDDS
jgi:hypothetical protein